MSGAMGEVSPAEAPPDARRVAIVCESTRCLPPELVQRYHIGIIPIPFVFDAQTFLDGVDMRAALVRERGGTDPRQARVMAQVRDFVDELRQFLELRQ